MHGPTQLWRQEERAEHGGDKATSGINGFLTTGPRARRGWLGAVVGRQRSGHQLTHHLRDRSMLRA